MEGVMKPFLGFMNEVKNVFLEQVKDVCMVVQRFSSEEVYDGRFPGMFLYDCVCRCLHIYVCTRI